MSHVRIASPLFSLLCFPARSQRRKGRPSLALALLLALCSLISLVCGEALAAGLPNAPTPPRTARITPSGGLLEVEQQAPVLTANGLSQVRVVLPAGAENFQISVPGHTIARWSSVPQTLDQSGDLAKVREERQHAVMTLTGKLQAVKAQLALWEAPATEGVFQDMMQREKRLAEVVPALSYEKADLERRLALLKQELQQLPPSPEMGQSVLVTLQKSVSAATLPVRYSYTLRNCGWRAVYCFDAQPDKGKGDAVNVRFMAEVWQFSGMDWADAQLMLVSRGQGPREPAPLPRWVIDSQPQPVAQPLVKAAPRMMMAADAAMPEAAPAAGPVAADVTGVYASWTLGEKGLPEGRARLLVLESEWKAPLQWLARPSTGESRVWLMARPALPESQIWPDGQAEFSVDGQSVGAGQFHASGKETTLYFGADPRVQVAASADVRQRGEKGFIGKSRTWTWGWTYTVRNTRDKAVTVRLERPMPMLVDQGVAVTYRDKPQAQQDAQEHLLFWNVDVAAGGKAEVKHELTITSPVEIQLDPYAP
ncbi:DUF4139 domain-containing protein [Desulfovibrio desulfuricans]|uniref:DUF4139 domain-containing protein n=1 Tax=Desulfovibrio desulfuricans TaxID=876 RepID=UPI0035B314E6